MTLIFTFRYEVLTELFSDDIWMTYYEYFSFFKSTLPHNTAPGYSQNKTRQTCEKTWYLGVPIGNGQPSLIEGDKNRFITISFLLALYLPHCWQYTSWRVKFYITIATFGLFSYLWIPDIRSIDESWYLCPEHNTFCCISGFFWKILLSII